MIVNKELEIMWKEALISPIFGTVPEFELRRTTNNLNQNNRYQDRDSDRAFLEWKSEMLPLEPNYSLSSRYQWRCSRVAPSLAEFPIRSASTADPGSSRQNESVLKRV
jgi:hypothetical protein